MRRTTPLLVALVAIESTDPLFAVDSIPAVLAVTRDLYLLYTSNVFALLGLRSHYFVLASALWHLRFLREGLAIVLLFAAAKLLLAEIVQIPPAVSLFAIISVLTLAVAASRLFPARPVSPPEKG